MIWLIYCIVAVLCGIASLFVYLYAARAVYDDPAMNEEGRGMLPVVLIMLIFLSALWPAAVAVLVAVCIISTMQEKE